MGKKSRNKRVNPAVGTTAGDRSERTTAGDSNPIEDGGGFGRTELLLFGAVLLLMAIRFAGLFSVAEPLPNWDAPGHFFVLEKMAGYMGHGRLSGYLQEWLGGMPLFQFYPPLFYALTVVGWWLTLKAVPLAMAFRAATFLAVFSSAVGLWFFVRSFLGRSAGRWAIILSAAFIFYPQTFSAYGIGAGAAFWIGLIPNCLGLSLGLIWLGLLERLRRRPESAGLLLAASLIGAGLALTHTLSAIFAVIVAAIWFLGNVRHWPKMGSVILSGVFSAGLAAFWLLPFLRGIGSTGGAMRGAEPNFSYFFAVLPLKVPYLEIGAIIVFLAAIGGSLLLVRRRQWSLATVWFGSIAFFLLRPWISRLIPSVGIHYYRFLATIFILELAVAAAAFDWLWSRWADGVGRRRVYVILLAASVALSFFNAYDILDRESVAAGRIRGQLAWSSREFPGYDEAQAVAAILKGKTDLLRCHVDLPLLAGLTEFGSASYFTERIPRGNGQMMLSGLFVESAAQAPFFMATMDTMRPQSPNWEDERLFLLRPFVEQAHQIQIERLKLFGVNYIASYSPEFQAALSVQPDAELTDRTAGFQIYRLNGWRPLAYVPAYRPAAYLSRYGRPSFRDLSLTVYAGERSYDFPVVESRQKLDDFLANGSDRFSAVIINASRLTSEEVKSLESSRLDLILFSPSPEAKAALAGKSGVTMVDRLEVMSKDNRKIVDAWPTGWVETMAAVASLKDKAATGSGGPVSATVNRFDAQRIEVAGDGPIIINAGHSSGWQAVDGRPIWRVTPDQMMVFAQGGETVALEYGPTTAGRWGQGISLLSVVSLAALVALRERKRRRG